MSADTNDIKIFLDTAVTEGKNTLIHKIHNSRYIFELPEAIALTPDDKYNLQIGLEQLSLCLTTKSIHALNDKIYINDNYVLLKHGNYNVDDFIDYVNSVFLGSAHYSDLQLTYSENTNKLTIISLTNQFTQLLFPTNKIASANKVLGITTSDNVMKPLPFEAEKGVALYYSTGVTVRINNLSNRNQNVNGGSSSIIRLPISQPAFTILNHFSDKPFMTSISDRQIGYIDISFHDDDGNLFDMEDRPFFVVLRLDYQKKLKDKKIVSPNK
jgi:hypothetical protein